MNPKDYQNVPAAVKLLKLIANISSLDGIKDLNPIVNDIKVEISLFSTISNLLMSIFTETAIILLDQLINFATLGFLLFFFFR